jgi:prolyl-tRNA editing enzyme YbaK/EbsC (Cys-tRNA(Pro) deacylase)
MRTSVEVHNHLQSMDVRYELVSLTDSVKNSARMAELLGLDLSSVIKILVFIADGLPLMVLVPGDRKANPAKIKKCVGAEKICFAAEKDVSDITDFQSRSTPPVAWKAKAGVIADESVAGAGVAYTAGGQPNVVLKMRATDLLRITEATIADIT